jgi:hypothetical protein
VSRDALHERGAVFRQPREAAIASRRLAGMACERRAPAPRPPPFRRPTPSPPNASVDSGFVAPPLGFDRGGAALRRLVVVARPAHLVLRASFRSPSGALGPRKAEFAQERLHAAVGLHLCPPAGQTLSSARLHPPGSNRQAASVTVPKRYGLSASSYSPTPDSPLISRKNVTAPLTPPKHGLRRTACIAKRTRRGVAAHAGPQAAS